MKLLKEGKVLAEIDDKRYLIAKGQAESAAKAAVEWDAPSST